MAVNKVVYAGTTLIDLTSDTVTASTLLKGYTAHSKSGAKITGTFDAAALQARITELESLLDPNEGNAILDSNAEVITDSIISLQPKSTVVSANENATFIVTGGSTYQWQQDTTNSDTWSDIATAAGRSNSFTIAGATYRNGYKYRCVVTDNSGNSEISDVAILCVKS